MKKGRVLIGTLLAQDDAERAYGDAIKIRDFCKEQSWDAHHALATTIAFLVFMVKIQSTDEELAVQRIKETIDAMMLDVTFPYVKGGDA